MSLTRPLASVATVLIVLIVSFVIFVLGLGECDIFGLTTPIPLIYLIAVSTCAGVFRICAWICTSRSPAHAKERRQYQRGHICKWQRERADRAARREGWLAGVVMKETGERAVRVMEGVAQCRIDGGNTHYIY
jgi:hypothetical protein